MILETALLAGALAAPPATFADPRGDAASAPDVAGVTVELASDNVLRFRITLVAPPAPSSQVLVAIDSDANPATGDRNGIEWLIRIEEGDAQLSRWTGTAFARVSAPREARLDGPVAATGVDVGPLRLSARIRFGVVGRLGDAADAAPDNGTWSYRLRAAPATLVGTRVTARPASPRAGLLFSIRARGRLTDGRVVAAQAACAARIGAHRLPGRCAWRIPRSAAGKRLTVIVKVSLGGRSRSRTLLFRVR